MQATDSKSGPSDQDAAPPFLQEFYANLAAISSVEVLVISDLAGHIQWANPAFQTLTGHSVAEAIGKTLGALVHGEETCPDTVEKIEAAVKLATSERFELVHYTKTGQPHWVELTTTPVRDAKGKHRHFLTSLHDIDHRKSAETHALEEKAEQNARRNERHLLMQTTGWLYAAKSLEELLKIVGRSMRTLIPEATGQLYIYSSSRDGLELASHWGPCFLTDHIERDDCWSLRRGRAYAYGMNEIDFPCPHSDDSANPSFCLPVIAHGDTIGMLHVCFPDIKVGKNKTPEIRRVLENRWDLALICAEQISLSVANVRLRQVLQDQSVRDQLTGLSNRRRFLDLGQKELNRAVARTDPLTLISIDVDHFKNFNDNHGHDAGDAVLRQLGQLLLREFTGNLLPCRLGGEEFAVLAPGTSTQDAVKLSDILREYVSELVVRSGGVQLPRITISVGVATVPDCGDDLETLMKSSDMALYAAKEAGRNRTMVFEMDAQTPKAAE